VKKALQYIRESREELRKVTWPTQEEVTSFTIVVVISVVIFAIFLELVDSGLMLLIQTLMK
jgi:preprotein translocase subunit SecE